MKKLLSLTVCFYIFNFLQAQTLAPYRKLNKKFIYVDSTTMKPVLQKEYNEAYPFSEGIARVKIGENESYIDKTGKEITLKKYESYGDFSNGLAAVKLNGKWGFIDKAGKEVTPVRYYEIKEFSEGFCPVKDHGYWGFIDSTGKETGISGGIFDYLEVGSFHNGFAKVKRGSNWTYLNRKGIQMTKKFSENFTSADDFSEGLAAVKESYRYGYIDTFGKYIIEPNYTVAWSFNDGIAVVTKENNKQALIDRTGKEIAEFKYANESGYYYGLVAVSNNGLYSFINKKGKSEKKLAGERYGIPGEGLVYFGNKNKKGEMEYIILNNELKLVNDSIFHMVFDFKEGLCRVKRNDLAGFIDKTGREVIPVQYDIASDFSNGFAGVRDISGNGFYIDKAGRQYREK